MVHPFSANQTFADLPEGNFTARILTTDVSYSTSPFLSISSLIQYDNRSRNLGLQSRVPYTLKPGSDFSSYCNRDGYAKGPAT
jgi:hypothetical protein